MLTRKLTIAVLNIQVSCGEVLMQKIVYEPNQSSHEGGCRQPHEVQGQLNLTLSQIAQQFPASL